MNDCYVITWLFSSIEEKISSGMIFLKTAKVIRDILQEVYGNEKILFTLKQVGIVVSEYYFALQGTLNTLDDH